MSQITHQSSIFELMHGTPEHVYIPSDYLPKVSIINQPAGLGKFCPIRESMYRKVMAGELKLNQYDEFPLAYQYQYLQRRFIHNYVAEQLTDTVVFFPCNSIDEEGAHDYASSFFNIVNCLKDRQGRHPLIAAVETKSPHEQPNYKYSKMKALYIKKAAGAFNSWLRDPEQSNIRNVVFTDLKTAKLCFPQIAFEKSFSKSAYTRWETSVVRGVGTGMQRQPINIMLTINPLQMVQGEDKGFDFTADILSIVRSTAKPPKIISHAIKNMDKLKTVLAGIRANQRELSIDIETTGLNPKYPNQEILTIGFSDGKEAWGFYVRPMYGKKVSDKWVLEPNHVNNYDMLRYLLESDFDFIMQNAKFELKWFMAKLGIMPKGMIYDTLLQDHWLFENLGAFSAKKKIRPGSYAMDNQIPRYLGITSHKGMLTKALEAAPYINPFEFPSGKEGIAALNISSDLSDTNNLRRYIQLVQSEDFYEPESGKYAMIPKILLLKYNNKDAYYTFKIFEEQMRLIRAEYNGKLPMVITHLFPKMLRSVATMEVEGAPLDYDHVLLEITKCDALIRQHKNAVTDAIGSEVTNIDSNEQVMNYMVYKLKIDKDEFYDIDEEEYVLDEHTLQNFYEIPGLQWTKDLVLYKKACKARNTYLIPFVFHSYKGRMYFNLQLTGTVTGRLSSNDPNIQNIPAQLGDKKKGVLVKSVIRAEGNRMLADLDLATAEVKVLTAICPDPALVEAIRKNFDLHCFTAALMSGIEYDEIYSSYLIKEGKKAGTVDDTVKAHMRLRNAAKRTTFGSIYRIGPKGLAKQIAAPIDQHLILQTAGKIAKDAGRTTPSSVDYRMAERSYQEKDAKRLLNLLFNDVYPTLNKTFKQSDNRVLRQGYDETIFGRRRRYTFTALRSVWELITKPYVWTPALPAVPKRAVCHLGKNYITPADAVQGINPVEGNWPEANTQQLEMVLPLQKLPTETILKFSGSARSLRQNVNFLVQSPTSDYMQFFIAELMEKIPAELEPVFHFTVHDSLVFSYKDSYKARGIIEETCKQAMEVYLPSLSDQLPVIIGFGGDFSKAYCENGK